MEISGRQRIKEIKLERMVIGLYHKVMFHAKFKASRKRRYFFIHTSFNS